MLFCLLSWANIYLLPAVSTRRFIGGALQRAANVFIEIIVFSSNAIAILISLMIW